MPYFLWTGLDITGKLHRGRRGASNETVLEFVLFQEQIALLRAREIHNRLFVPRLSYKNLGQINSHLALLLQAGVRLAEAVELVSELSSHKVISPLLAECARSIREGESFHKILESHIPIIDSLMVRVIGSAEKSGTLAQACHILSMHYDEQNAFSQHIKNALLLPMITVILFILSSLGIFIFVIPRFESLFTVVNKSPEKLTRLLFIFSNFLCNSSLAHSAILLVGIIFLLLYFWKKSKKNGVLDSWSIKLPFMRRLTVYYNMTLFLQAFALLLQSGVSLVDALEAAQEVVVNKVLREKIIHITDQVISGVPLSQASSLYSWIFFKHAQAFFSIGEASGSLGSMAQKSAEMYRIELNDLLNKWIKALPIFFLLLLGSLIALLIIAIYTPLLNLSHAIN